MRWYLMGWLAIGIISFSSLLFAEEPAKSPTAAPLPAGGKPCQGTLRIGDKTYKLEHAVAYEVKVFDDDAISVIVSEKPVDLKKLKAALSDGKKNDDHFSVFQPHVKITFNKEGKTSFCNAWADNTSLSVSGSDLAGELTIKDGRAIGQSRLETGDEGRKRGFDVVFSVPMLVTPLPAPTPEEPEKPTAKARGKSKKAAKAKPESVVNVRDLPMPKNATKIEYKSLVEHIGYESPSDYKTLATFLSQRLAEQGWTTPDSDLVGSKSAILKREKGNAELTIFVKPAAKGSTVTIMSSGLSWEEPKLVGEPGPAAAPAP